MAGKRIREYLGGYVRVGVKGKNPERLVNLCLSAGFPVWDFSSEGGTVSFSTTLAKYRDIHRLARRARCTPHIVRRAGLPFIVGRIRKRPFFLLAAALVLAVLVYLSGSIWQIRVSGNTTVDTRKILDAAATAGLQPGARKAGLVSARIEAAVALANPEITWVYAHFQGTLATLEVVERTRPESPGPGDVVAAKDGVIQSILVLSGQPVVRPGQTVKAGELLIAGNTSGAIQGARGSVIAKTWYQVYREIPLSRPVPARTGRKVEMTVLRFRANEFVLWGKSNAFRWYEVEDYPKWRIPWGAGSALDVFVRVLFEVEWTETRAQPDEAFAEAESQMRRTIESQLPSQAKLVDLSCNKEATTESMISVRATACAVEEIGEVRPWPREDGGR